MSLHISGNQLHSQLLDDVLPDDTSLFDTQPGSGPGPSIEYPVPSNATPPGSDVVAPANGEDPGGVALAKLQEAMRSWIQQKGHDPVMALERLMQKNQVLLLGEQHDANPHRLALPEYILAAVAGGATHLAVEFDPQDQAGIDHYMSTGDSSKLHGAMRAPGYFDALEAARKTGLKIVAIDNKKYDDRDGVMALGIERILRRDPHAKVVAVIGANHVGDIFYEDGTLHPDLSVTRRLRESGLSVVSVNGAINGTLSRAARVNDPTLIPTSGSPVESVLSHPPDVVNRPGGGFDYLIYYPPK